MFYFGLDLGQTSDPSAGIILEAHGEGDERTYDCRHIEQYRLGPVTRISCGPSSDLCDREPLWGQCTFVIDHTGVGRPIFDMFLEAKLEPIGITITGGAGWHRETFRQWHVAKIQLVGTVQRFLQSGRLRIGAKLPHAGTLQKELRDFRVKISKAANETYESTRRRPRRSGVEPRHCALCRGASGPQMAPCGDISWREGLPVLIRGASSAGAWWRRAEVWRQPQERLRSLLSKAVENLAAASRKATSKPRSRCLKAVGMYGDGTMNAIHEQDPEKLIRQQAEAQVDREGVPRNTLLAMAEHLDNAAWRHRLAEVEAEIRRTYLDE